MIWKYVDNHMISDMSSELMLGNMMHKTGELILSRRWFYSTELRILNIQIIVAGLFGIMSSWHRVRVFASIFVSISVIVCSYFCFAQLGYKKEAPILSTFLIMPFSSDYFVFLLQFLHNTVHNLIPLLILGMLFCFLRKNDNQKCLKWYVPFFLFSFVSTLDGLRMILVLYLPLLITILFLYNVKIVDKKMLICSMVCFGASLCGFMVNSTILSRIYCFQPHEDIAFIPFSFDTFSDVLGAWLIEYGYIENAKVFSIGGITNIFVLIIIMLLVFSCIKLLKNINDLSKQEALLVAFFSSAFVIFTLAETFLSLEHNARYTAPIAIFGFAVIFVYLKKVELGKISGKLDNVFKPKHITCVILIAITISSCSYYYNYAKTNQTEEQQQLADLMVARGMKQGYGGYWIAN